MTSSKLVATAAILMGALSAQLVFAQDRNPSPPPPPTIIPSPDVPVPSPRAPDPPPPEVFSPPFQPPMREPSPPPLAAPPPSPPQEVEFIVRWGPVENLGNFRATLEFQSSTLAAGVQLDYTGPQPLSNPINGPAADAAPGFTFSIGPNAVLGFSLTGAAIGITPSFEDLVTLEFSSDNEGEEFCIVSDSANTVVASVSGTPLVKEFQGPTCIILEGDEIECPFEGTGDVNQDGVLNISDIIVLVEFISVNIPLQDECSELAGDLNADGLVNIQDIVAAVEAITG